MASSEQPVVGRRRLLALAAVLWLGCLTYLSVIQRLPEFWGLDIDRLEGPAHVLVSFVLVLVVHAFFSPLRSGRSIATAAAIALVISVGVELLQFGTDGRTVTWSDLGLDVLGIAIGIAAVLLATLVASDRAIVTGIAAFVLSAVVATAAIVVVYRPEAQAERTDSRIERQLDEALCEYRADTEDPARLEIDFTAMVDLATLDPLCLPTSRSDVAIVALDAGAVAVSGDGVRFDGTTDSLLATDRSLPMTAAMVATNEMSAWVQVRPSDVTQTGPARILAISRGVLSQEINFQMGQEGTALSVRVRAGRATDEVYEEIVDGVFGGEESVLLGVSVTAEEMIIYVDGEALRRVERDFDLSFWAPEYRLLFGNEITGTRPFAGTIGHAGVAVGIARDRFEP